MEDRNLASIKRIDSIHTIPDADAIDRAVIGGWSVVVKKGEFQPEDLCIYFEIDSLLPDWAEYEFLKKSSWKPALEKYRLKTAKLRGVISQGLALPINIFSDINLSDFNVGDDLTELLQVEKYEPPIPTSLGGEVKGGFPSFIPKTDEERFQNVPDILNRHSDTEFVITEKVDGTSSTFYFKDGEFGFCGRNWEFKLATENTYSEIAKKYNLADKLANYSIAIQGEILGPGIQGNKYKLTEHTFFAFHAYDHEKRCYLDHDDFVDFCTNLGVNTVPVLGIAKFDSITVEKLLEMADGESKLYKTKREGIVIKSRTESTDIETGRLSFKVISNKFLMKHGE